MPDIDLPDVGEDSWGDKLNTAVVSINSAVDGLPADIANPASSVGASVAGIVNAATADKLDAADVEPLIDAAIIGLGPSSGFIVTSDPDWPFVIVAEPAPGPTLLTAPTLTSLTGGKNQATATWTAPSPLDPLAPITDYSIRYRIVGTSTWNYFAHTASTALTRVITGLANGAANNYEVQVAAVNAAGVGAYSASLTVIPGAVNGVVFSDTGARVAADLVGSAPTLGPENWAGTSGNFAVDGTYIASKSTAAGNLQTVGIGAKGLFKLTGVINVDTLAGASAVSTRIYPKDKDSANYIYFGIGISTSSVVSFSLFANAAGSGAAVSLGMPAGALPSGAAAADYSFTIEQTSETSITVTFNGSARTATLTSPQAAALVDATIFGLTTNSTRVKYKNLAIAVNGYYTS